jgi:hypothetical protein
VFDRQQIDIATLADAIATRRGRRDADESCALLAAVVLLTHRRALTRWIAGPASTDLGTVIADEFALLASVIGPEARSNGRRSTSGSARR